MKLTITREELRQFVLREANIDISQAPIDIEIEGYKQMEGRYKWQETTDKELKELFRNRCADGKDIDSVAKEILAEVSGGSVNDSTSELAKKLIWRDDDRKVITDKEGRVLDIVKEEKERNPFPWKTKIDKSMEKIYKSVIDEARKQGVTQGVDIVTGEKYVLNEKQEKEPEKPKKAEIKNKWAGNLNSRPDYTDYENTVLDFATSNEHKRQVPFFGAGTIDCCKARYQKIIDKLKVKDSVKFSRINCLPYLVKIEGSQSMNDILNEGVNK